MTAVCTYKPIGPGETGAASTRFFMMNTLLYSRVDCGHPSNDRYYDEDVNVYLANLLESLIHPEYHEKMKKYVIPYDLPLFEMVSSETDPRTKYMFYRYNADFLLVSLGVFNNPRNGRPGSAPHMEIPVESYIGRGKVYYDLAQSYLLQTLHRGTAMSDIMGKLASGFETYVEILSMMKSEYFNIYDRITDGEMYHLELSLKKEDLKQVLAGMYDDFLDAYSDYRETGTEESRKKLDAKVAGIRSIDPSFDFTISD